MRRDHRWIVAFVGNALFLFLVAQLNHHLSDVPLPSIAGEAHSHLFLIGLPVAFAALRLTLNQALAATIPTALFAEAGLPFPPGTLLLPAVACVCVAIAFRANFNRFEPSMAVLAAVIMNLVLLATLTAVAWTQGLISPARIVIDLVISQLVLAVLTGWFFALQTALMGIFGFDLETELRESV